ncbi:hypothetical protein IWW38_006316, partial [Coemansia aciculifera]
MLRLSPASENTIIAQLRSGALTLPPQPPVVELLGEREWTRAANFVYETLVLYGFACEDVERAMVAARGSGDLVDALTWLCVNIPTERMPVDMRDKHEFSGVSERTGEEEEEVEKEKEEDSKEAMPSLPLPPMARIDQRPSDDEENTAIDLSDLGLDNYPDSGSDSDSDCDPSLRHAEYVLRLRGYEEWTEYLKSNNTLKRHSGRIKELQRRTAMAKRTLESIESDLLFASTQSLRACERLWPEYHDALLDDIRRFKERQESV